MPAPKRRQRSAPGAPVAREVTNQVNLANPITVTPGLDRVPTGKSGERHSLRGGGRVPGQGGPRHGRGNPRLLSNNETSIGTGRRGRKQMLGLIRNARQQGSANIGTGPRMRSSFGGPQIASNQAAYRGGHSQAPVKNPRRVGPPLNLRDLQRNVKIGGMSKERAAQIASERSSLFNIGGGGKDWRQNIYGDDFKAGEFNKLKGIIAFADEAARQGQPLPGNLTEESVSAARARLAELLAKRKAALKKQPIPPAEV